MLRHDADLHALQEDLPGRPQEARARTMRPRQIGPWMDLEARQRSVPGALMWVDPTRTRYPSAREPSRSGVTSRAPAAVTSSLSLA